jgi:hypothetical protein
LFRNVDEVVFGGEIIGGVRFLGQFGSVIEVLTEIVQGFILETRILAKILPIFQIYIIFIFPI